MQKIIEQDGKYTYMEYIVIIIASTLTVRQNSRIERLRAEMKEELKGSD